ncbi:hypothetical protein PMI01_03108, partial [Caulobacter sp. AP07]|uniref:hypothetical protein n=1 Tax=Caulobacter sp. AP07 TaxID=1144304 RepID=UPI000271F7B7
TASAAAANAAGAAAVATANAAAAALAATNTPPAAAQPSAATTGVKASIRDLFQNDQGDADLGDFQMILISLVAAGIFLWSSLLFMSVLDVVKTTTLPDIDTTLLGTFGLGQGAYLIKKAALPAGQG